jgi:hypothetical protein
VPVEFNGFTWSPAPASLAEASFERAEVYKVIEADGPTFPQAIADRIGSTREAVRNLVAKMVEAGSVVRTRRGYVVAGVTIVTGTEEPKDVETAVSGSSGSSDPRAPARAGVSSASGSSSSYDNDLEEREAPGTRARPRVEPVVVEVDRSTWAAPCYWYDDHRDRHRWTSAGWVCDACNPEDAS